MKRRWIKPQLDEARLKEKRLEKDWSKVEASEHMNIPQSVYSQYEGGTSKPSYSALRNIALTLGTSVDYLTNKTDDDRPIEYLVSGDDDQLLYLVETYHESGEEDRQRLVNYARKLRNER